MFVHISCINMHICLLVIVIKRLKIIHNYYISHSKIISEILTFQELTSFINKKHILFSLQEVVGVGDIDQEFEEFVRKNYFKLTENQKKICEKLGIAVPR